MKNLFKRLKEKTMKKDKEVNYKFGDLLLRYIAKFVLLFFGVTLVVYLFFNITGLYHAWETMSGVVFKQILLISLGLTLILLNIYYIFIKKN